MIAEQLLRVKWPTPTGLELNVDPLRTDDVLQEAQLLDLKIESAESRAALLFDLRTALQLRFGVAAAVLVIRDLRTATWKQEPRSTRWTAWNVVGSAPRVETDGFGLTLHFDPSAELRVVTGGSAEVYVVEIDGLAARPPDFIGDDDLTIVSGLPRWTSSIRVLAGSVFNWTG